MVKQIIISDSVHCMSLLKLMDLKKKLHGLSGYDGKLFYFHFRGDTKEKFSIGPLGTARQHLS
jgi:hypothetical protein